MFVFSSFLYPWTVGKQINLDPLLYKLVLWILGGLIFGFIMKIYTRTYS